MSEEPLSLPNPESQGGSRNDPPNNAAGAPSGDEGGATSGKHSKQRSRRRQYNQQSFFSLEQCLAALSRLPYLVIRGVLTPAQANSIRAQLQALVNYHLHSQRGRDPVHIEDDALLSLLRTNPDALKGFEPFLTDEQIEMLSREADKDEEE
jgi:hypothetical protein